MWELLARRFFRLLQSGRPQDALELARLYTKVRPRDSAGWIYVNNAEVALGRREQGLLALAAGIQLNPQATELRWTEAESLMSLGREEEAKDTLERLLAADTEDPYAYAGLARLALRRGELDIARSMAEEGARHVRRAGSDESTLLLSVASTLLALPSASEEAEALFIRAANQTTFNPAPHLVLAAIKKVQRDSRAEASHLSDARACWRGSEDEFRREIGVYEDAVRTALDYADANKP